MQAGDRGGGNYGADGGGDIIYRMDYKRIMMVMAGESVCMSGGGDWVVTTSQSPQARQKQNPPYLRTGGSANGVEQVKFNSAA
jgi:hypothetical protein